MVELIESILSRGFREPQWQDDAVIFNRIPSQQRIFHPINILDLLFGQNSLLQVSMTQQAIMTGKTKQNSTEMGPFESLLPQLTLEEKVSLLSGDGFHSTPGVSRLNIPPVHVRACSHIEPNGDVTSPILPFH